MKIKSMTGFGRGEAANESVRYGVEMRGVNHRYLDVRVRIPQEINEFEAVLRSRVCEVVKRGRVEVRMGTLGDNPQVIGGAGPGELIGEMCLFDDTPHMASVVALEETEVNAMSRDEFLKRLDEMDPVLKTSVKMIIRRARQMAIALRKRGGDANWYAFERQ